MPRIIPWASSAHVSTTRVETRGTSGGTFKAHRAICLVHGKRSPHGVCFRCGCPARDRRACHCYAVAGVPAIERTCACVADTPPRPCTAGTPRRGRPVLSPREARWLFASARYALPSWGRLAAAIVPHGAGAHGTAMAGPVFWARGRTRASVADTPPRPCTAGTPRRGCAGLSPCEARRLFASARYACPLMGPACRRDCPSWGRRAWHCYGRASFLGSRTHTCVRG